MDIQRFIKDRHKLLDKFEADWEKRRRKDPDRYQADLPADEWDRQLTFWLHNLVKPEKSDK